MAIVPISPRARAMAPSNSWRRLSRYYVALKARERYKINGQLRKGGRNGKTQECEDSLRRLQADVIDLYQIHWPIPDEDIEEGWEALTELEDEGKVRHIGVSNFDVEQMKRIDDVAPVETLQPPYNLIDRGVEDDVLPYCEEDDIGVIVYSPMKSGLLTGKMTPERVENLPHDDWRRDAPEFNEPRLSRNLDLVSLLEDIGAEHDKSPAEVSIAWTLRHPAVTADIVGGRRPDQVDGIIGAAEFRLSDDELEHIENFIRENP